MDLCRRRLLKSVSSTGFALQQIRAQHSPLTSGASRNAVQNDSEIWAMYQKDAQNTGQADRAPVTDVDIAWQTELGGSDFGKSLSSAVISDGQLVVSQNRESGEQLVALDIDTGTERWTYTTEESQGSGLRPTEPAVEDGFVYSAIDRTLVAVNAEDGSVRWQNDEFARGPFKGIVIHNGTLYTTDSWEIFAVDAATGEVSWSFEPEDDLSGPVTTERSILGINLAVTDGTVYYNTLISETDVEEETRQRFEGVAALDIDSREERWIFESYEGEYDALEAEEINVDQSSPAVVDGTVYSGLPQGLVCALDTESGSLEWQVETDSPTRFSPAVDEEQVYIHHGGQLCAYEKASGDEQWCASTSRVSPVVTEEAVYTHNSAHDKETGESLWSLELRSRRGNPALGNDRMYCILGESGAEGVYALEESEPDGGDGNTNRSSNETDAENTTPTDGSSTDTGAGDTNGSVKTETDTGTSMFQQFGDSNGFPLLLLLAAAGAGYGAYRRWISDDTAPNGQLAPPQEQGSTTGRRADDMPAPEESVTREGERGRQATTGGDFGPTIESYADMQIKETSDRLNSADLHEAVAGQHSLWVLTPVTDGGDTVGTNQLAEFETRIEPWYKMENHPNLLSVYGHGTEPFPWLAVERGDYVAAPERRESLTSEDIYRLLQQVCEAVHHVQRYGITYQNLTPQSVMLTNQSQVKLRGPLDHFDADEPAYSAPEETSGDVTERSLVYRIGTVGRKLILGKRSKSRQIAVSDTLWTELERARSADPADRHETVLHLRDRVAATR